MIAIDGWNDLISWFHFPPPQFLTLRNKSVSEGWHFGLGYSPLYPTKLDAHDPGEIARGKIEAQRLTLRSANLWANRSRPRKDRFSSNRQACYAWRRDNWPPGPISSLAFSITPLKSVLMFCWVLSFCQRFPGPLPQIYWALHGFWFQAVFSITRNAPGRRSRLADRKISR